MKKLLLLLLTIAILAAFPVTSASAQGLPVITVEREFTEELCTECGVQKLRISTTVLFHAVVHAVADRSAFGTLRRSAKRDLQGNLLSPCVNSLHRESVSRSFPPSGLSITFDPNGGDLAGSSSRHTNSEGRIAELFPMAVRSGGFVLDGWFTAREGGERVDNTTVFFEQTTLFAQWRLMDGEFLITLDYNGANRGSLPENLATVQRRLFGLPNTVTRTGFHFDGWFTSREGGERVIHMSTVFSGNTTIFARWIRNADAQVHRISLNGNYSGTPEFEAVSTRFCGRLTSLPVPSRQGFRFEGWYTQSSGGERIAAGLDTGTRFTAPATLFARWSVFDGFTITFNANEGTFAPDAVLTRETDGNGRLMPAISENAPIPVRGGYRFIEWRTSPDPTGGERIWNTHTFTEDTTVYARWQPVTVTFNRNGGLNASTPDNAVVGSDNRLESLPVPVREDFEFVGWYTAQVGGERVTTEREYTGGTTVFARWRSSVPDTFTITFDMNVSAEAIVFMPTTIFRTDEAGELVGHLPWPRRNDQPPSPSGWDMIWELEQWRTSPETNGGERVNRDFVFTADTTVYAHWHLVHAAVLA
jgi:hypothetical protein